MATLKSIAIIITSILLLSLSYAKSASDSRNSYHIGNAYNEEWDLRHTIPGEPEIDYPIYAHPIKTNFNCEGRHQGYYADVETRCQLFRICTNTDLTGEGFAFLCPNGTLFSQQYFICDWYKNVDCGESESYYFKNEEIGNSVDHDELMETAKEMVEYPMKNKSTIGKKPITPIIYGGGGAGAGSGSTSGSGNIRTNSLKNILGTSIGPTQTNQEKLIDIRFGTSDNSPKSAANENGDGFNKSITSPTPSSSTKNNNNQQKKLTENSSRVSQSDRNSRIRTTIQTPSTKAVRTTTQTPLRSATPANRVNSPASGGQRLKNQEKVYVNSLGELSTDVGTNFDPKTAFIVDKSSENRRGIKKSLDDVIGDSTAYRNHLEKRKKEQLKHGIQTQYREIVSEPKSLLDHLHQEQSRTKLSFAEKVNAGLKDIQVLPNTVLAQVSTGTTTERPKIIGHGRSQEFHGNFINLADNVNSGLFHDQSKSGIKLSAASSGYNSSSILSSRSGPADSVLNLSQTGKTFQGYETVVPPKSSLPSNFRQGRQFQFSGSAFTKSTILAEAQPTLNSNAYLPPAVTGAQPSSVTSQNSIGPQTLTEIDRLTTNLETLKKILNNEQNQNEPRSNVVTSIHHINDAAEKNGFNLPMVISKDINVKKRAEELLLQGVHQAIYENQNSSIEIVDNNLKESQIENSNKILLTVNNSYNAFPYEPMIIRVFGNSDEEDNENGSREDRIEQSIPTNFINASIERHEFTASDLLTTSYNISGTPSRIADSNKLKLATNNDDRLIKTDKYLLSNKLRTANYNNSIITRRQTAKPILYSKKPYTVRSYPKTSSTTAKPNKYLVGNRRSRFRNRLALKENTTDPATDSIGKFNREQEQHDLTAVANTYGSLSNKNKYTLLKRIRPSYNLLRNKLASTTSTPQVTTNKHFVKGDLNLQKSSNYHHHQNSNSAFGNQPGINPLRPPPLTKTSVSYTEIPGTNIKISKSNEEATFILSSDPRHLAQFRTPAPTSSSQKNGYVPLNEYITNTLNGQIRNLAAQSQTTNLKHLTQPQASQQPTYSTDRPTIQQPVVFNQNVYSHQQGLGTYQNSIQLSNPVVQQTYGYQVQTTTADPFQQANIFGASGNVASQQNSYYQLQNEHLDSIFLNNLYNNNQLLHQQTNVPNNPLLNNIFSNSKVVVATTTQSPPTASPLTKVNFYNNLSEAAVILPQIQNFQNQLTPNYNQISSALPAISDYNFSQPSAERRLDVVEDDQKESLYSKGVSSYHVPIGSIGRLANDRLVKRFK